MLHTNHLVGGPFLVHQCTRALYSFLLRSLILELRLNSPFWRRNVRGYYWAMFDNYVQLMLVQSRQCLVDKVRHVMRNHTVWKYNVLKLFMFCSNGRHFLTLRNELNDFTRRVQRCKAVIASHRFSMCLNFGFNSDQFWCIMKLSFMKTVI